MASTWTSGNTGYDAARSLRGTKMELRGNTYQHRDWIKSQGGRYSKATETWTIPLPGNNRTCSELLHQLAQRGLEYRTK